MQASREQVTRREGSGEPHAEPHGWLTTETLKTRVGEFEFKSGYPTDDTAQRLRDLQTLNRATADGSVGIDFDPPATEGEGELDPDGALPARHTSVVVPN